MVLQQNAVVTHHRLVADAEGKLRPAGQLEQPLVVRPTSETIIGELFANWVQSYRDLPVKINQWAVVRWEMRTRMFLRTASLWQEGHGLPQQTKHIATKRMLQVYVDLAQNYLAMPVAGEKTESERFPGQITFCIEAMMQDKRRYKLAHHIFLGKTLLKLLIFNFRIKRHSYNCMDNLLGRLYAFNRWFDHDPQR